MKPKLLILTGPQGSGNHLFAKIISTNHTATYPDGSKAYPCVLMAC